MCPCGDRDGPSQPLGCSLAGELGVGGRQRDAGPRYVHDLLSAAPPPGAPLFHPSRVRQLEEELRTMDQTLKSLIASEEEVLQQGHGAMCSSPLSLCCCLSSHASHLSSLHCCLGRSPHLAFPSIAVGRRGASVGWARSSMSALLLRGMQEHGGSSGSRDAW